MRSLFGKLKNLHDVPPPPPKRIDTNSGCGWSEEEFDDEDGDTYEAPPCERPNIKIPLQHVEENVYLDYSERPPQPVISQRKAAPPPPRPAKNLPKMRPHDQEEFYADPSEGQCPEVSHKDNADKKMTPRRRPPAVPPSDQEEDVYLDPNEGQIEMEPPHHGHPKHAPVRPPVPRAGVRMLQPKKDPPPLMKPPIPRAKSNSNIISDSVKPAPPPEMKNYSFSATLPSPPPNNRPPSQMGIKKPIASPPTSPSADCVAQMMPPGGQESGLEEREWFAGLCGRKPAEDALLKVNKDGAFMVRNSTAQNTQQPFTLVVLFNQKVYNVPIRYLKDSCSYALGKEGKKSEELFSSLQEMISHHRNNPLLLIDSKHQAKHTTYLIHPVQPQKS
ncbi:B-cell linker protein [Trichomycterus rosablanca]|uniref:B-cell linker protein n=1 Tax=Trichomycterus rosablanca TaxID=2290929 RepID=UPI002F351A8B